MTRSRTPRVSVVVIYRNEERFLPAAVRSVQQQTYRDWELVLVDDGSTDGGSQYGHELAAAVPGVSYLTHPGRANRGMAASRNLGIASARGAYLSFLDGDDVWLPGKLERQIGILERVPEAGFLVAPAMWWYDWPGSTSTQANHLQTLRQSGTVDGTIAPPALLQDFLADEWRSLCDVLVRRSCVDAVGGYETAFTGMFEDQAFHAKLCLRFSAVVDPVNQYLYRQHDAACTARSHATGTWRSERRRFLRWLATYLAAMPPGDPVANGVRALVRHEQRRLSLATRVRSRVRGLR